jgi:hypothetical protein
MNITYSECMSVALFIQHAMPLSHIVRFSPQCPINGTIVEINVTEHVTCVLIFSKNFVWTIFILTRTEPKMIKNVYRSSCEVRVIFVRF